MKSRLTFLALSVAFSLLSSGCLIHIGNGWDWDEDGRWDIENSHVEKTEARVVTDFKSIEVNGSTDVSIRIGEATSVIVSGPDDLVPHVLTEVTEGKLAIGMKPGSYRSTRRLRVTVTTPSIERVSVNGSADVQVAGLAGGKLEARIQGSGDIAARGHVEALTASIAGSGDLELYELVAREAWIEISGSGDAAVNAAEALSVAIHGSGDVSYRGSPKLTASVSGSGGVHNAGRAHD